MTNDPTVTPVYVLLYAPAPRSWLDGIISRFERIRYPAAAARYIHAAIMVDDLLVEEQAMGPEYHDGQDAVTRAREAAAYSAVPVTAEQKADVRAYLESMRGTRYDVPQLIEDGLDILTGHRDSDRPGRMAVCSQLVCLALSAASLKPPFPCSSCTPSDLYGWPVHVTLGAPPV